ncbi:MAG: T9SS type A sorting domain-containing protein, partial [Saprospiraceae bacterium]
LHQVLLWKNIEEAGDFSKVIVLGQSSLQNIQPAIGSDRLFMPSTILALDNELWVGEFKFSSRILKFSPGPTKNEDLNKAGMQSIEIFPNPVDDEFILKLTQPVQSTKGFQILDLHGRTIQCIDEIIQLSNASYRVQLNAEDLTEGIYFISYTDTQQKLLAKFIRTY